jgi:predicted deacylase
MGSVETRMLTRTHEDGEIEVPVIEITGGPGPTLTIIAGLHGCEYAGIEAARRLVVEVSPDSLRGRLRVVPLANLPAFYGHTEWYIAIDGKNPNRVFPGSPDGTYSESLADLITNEVLKGSDAVLDTHGGDIFEALVPYSALTAETGSEVDRQSAELAHVYDLPFILRGKPRAQGVTQGPLRQAAIDLGIAAVLHESGGQALLVEEDILTHVRGMRNTLRHLGMIDGEPDLRHHPKELTGGFWTVATKGLWYPEVDLFDHVTQGARVGVVRDVFGEEVEVITAAQDAWIIAIVTSLSCKPDGIVLQVAY